MVNNSFSRSVVVPSGLRFALIATTCLMLDGLMTLPSFARTAIQPGNGGVATLSCDLRDGRAIAHYTARTTDGGSITGVWLTLIFSNGETRVDIHPTIPPTATYGNTRTASAAATVSIGGSTVAVYSNGGVRTYDIPRFTTDCD